MLNKLLKIRNIIVKYCKFLIAEFAYAWRIFDVAGIYCPHNIEKNTG